jgi:hypothetical protein
VVIAPGSVAKLAKDFAIDPGTSGPDGLPGTITAALLDLVESSIVAKRVADVVNAGLFDLVGLLHLERMVMTPLDTERGELLYSLPLSPEETVTLAHKEWTIVETDFSRYIEDYLENYSETGVAQSNELTTTTNTQMQRQDATSANLNSMSGQAVTATGAVTPAAGSSTVNAASSMQQSVADMREVTQTASTRTIRDQKTSFTVTTVKGSEDWTARLLKNSRTDRSMMVDYYRRVRRWRTELYRYGVRLTYDIVVPHPGRAVWQIYQGVLAMQKQLAQGFVMPLDVFSIDEGNWQTLASDYHVALPPPPQDMTVDVSRKLDYAGPGRNTEEIQLAVPPNYRIASLSFEIDSGVYPGAAGDKGAVMLIGPNVWNYVSPGAMNVDTGTIGVPLANIPLEGPVNAVLLALNLDWGTARLFANVTATDQSMNAWRQNCWGILREAALARYQQLQDQLRIAMAAQQRAIAAADTLSLRRIEREYIMMACLEWLFPFLNLQSGWFDGIGDTPTELDRVAGFQESVLIKLMHTAIDWDQMLITLLPFFWEQTQSDRVFVDHADPLHREFLRAGAARVILPIRPGYETEIMSLFDLGYVGAKGANRYASVINDVQAANAAFDTASHPAAATGPDGTILAAYTDDYPVEAGKLIGRWHDVMPTAAIDMDVTFQPVAGA